MDYPRRPARDPGPRRLDRRDPRDCRAGRPPDAAEQGFDISTSTGSTGPATRPARSTPGLKVARGEFVAIFDADFVRPGRLPAPHGAAVRRSEGRHGAGALGPHQPRLLAADAHPVDPARRPLRARARRRNRAGCFFNFNGTAGIWRREVIADAGGWQHDTLTEDLDLSYRAQLRGWRFVFMQDLVSPAEVPVEMNAFKSQQHRWAKGSIQTCRKVLPRSCSRTCRSRSRPRRSSTSPRTSTTC